MLIKYLPVILLSGAVICLTYGVVKLYGAADKFEKKAELLESRVLSASDQAQAVSLETGAVNNARYIVFISVSDTRQRAAVFQGKGNTPQEAWKNAKSLTKRFIVTNDYDPAWIKVDIVNQVSKITTADLYKQIKLLPENFLREGISFDGSFNIALLEAEISGNKIIDYDGDKLNLDNLNSYLKQYNRGSLMQIPDSLWLFSCQGYFCDNNNKVYELYNNDEDYGRRKIDVVDKNVARGLTDTASQFLVNIVQKDGSFIYGYYPTYDREIQDYNTMRHIGAVWSLIKQYKNTGDQTLVPPIDSTLNYVVQGFIDYPGQDTAYVVERKANEVRIGANGLAILMLVDYMEAFQTDKYKELVIKLGNGILELQDPKTGKYYQVLNSQDFSRKEEFQTVFFDGESTYGLVKLYAYSNDKKYLTAACKAADYFIANDYTKYKDHWIAYSMNELTRYAPEARYYEFALRNAQVNVKTINNAETTYHVFFELLMATFDAYDRIKQNNIPLPYLKEFDEKYFIETIYKRARMGLNGYMYPEYAMYLQNPARIVNTFFIRQDCYRIRIDDMQHFNMGYYAYYNNYDKLEKYRKDLGIAD
ncbi:MAG TPA: glycosyl hydrolase family 88 [Syntrophomonadaceae bacterium]|nr:glycosyl hydrolase family 88 [Syntrophomonadaceae bacterium]